MTFLWERWKEWMKVGEKILPGEWVRGKGKEGKELSKGVSSDMI